MPRRMIHSSRSFAKLGVALLFLTGCQSVYYGTMEKLSYQKRDILVDRVQEARDVQEEAKEQFQSALEEFSSVMNFHGGDLEEKYDRLKDEYDLSESKAEAVRDRISAVEDVAEALFAEWEAELSQYSNDRLRRSSKRKLARTRRCGWARWRRLHSRGCQRSPGSNL